MNRIGPPARIAFALGIIGLGVLGVVYGDFASGWPKWVPSRQALTYAAAVVMMLGGAGMLFARSAALATRVLLPYLMIWLALRLPRVIMAPQIEVNWQSAAEVAVLAAGAWTLFAESAASGDRGRRIARVLFGLALPAFGLSHIFYVRETASLVPAWLPYHMGWAYATGVAHIAAGLGVLLSIYPRLAAGMEAAMLTIFTLLVWVPAIVAAPRDQGDWSEFVLSWAISAGAWVVAASIAPGNGRSPRAAKE